MKISVVTISFNQARFLQKAIDSVLGQHYEDLEYIIVDPGSTDGSREIIGKNRSNFSKIVLEPDCGPAGGLNKGFSHATGDILYYLNADDIALPGAFSCALRYFNSNPDIDVLYGHGLMIDVNENFIRRIFSYEWDMSSSVFVFNIIQQSTFFRNSVFRKSGGFNPANRTSWDYELLVDLELAGAKFKRISEFLGGFRMYPDSITGSQKLAREKSLDIQRIASRIYGSQWNSKFRLQALLYKIMLTVKHAPYITRGRLDSILAYLGLNGPQNFSPQENQVKK